MANAYAAVLADLLDDAEDPEEARVPWEKSARPEQLAPPGGWFVWLILAGRGWGKLLDVSTPIPTPSGWAKLSEIKIGDEVFDEAGRPCRVTATFDAMPEVAYRVRFSDGTHVDACADHQWVTWTHAERKVFLRSPYENPTRFPDEWPQWRLRRMLGRYLDRETIEAALALHRSGWSARSIAAAVGANRASLAAHLAAGAYVPREPVIHADAPGPQIRTTQQIADTLTYGRRGDLNHCIPSCGPLRLPAVELPVDPYFLGVWLGDGHTDAAAITCDDEPTLTELRRLGVRVTRYAGGGITYGVAMADGRSLHVMLRNLGVLGDKHVPAAYLRASAAQRLSLLQGLMDADGYVEASKAEFTNTNKALVDAVTELARSLGQKPVVHAERATLYGRDCGPKWRVTWRPTVQVFRLPRKAGTLTFGGAQSLRNHHRMITSMERIDPVPMRCLTVDGPNSMFLAGEGMIPTHNSRTAAEWSAGKARRYPRCRIALVAATIADARDTMVEGESGLLACFDDAELRGGSQDAAWNRSLGELYLANGSRFKTFTSEKPRRLRGPQHHFAWGDESAFWADSHKGTITDTTWTNLAIATRLPARPGWDAEYHAQICVATTPRPVTLLRTIDPDPARAGLMQRDTTIITRGKTTDNLANLSESYKAQVIAPLIGTRLGRQELDAELLEDREDALWRRDWIDADRRPPVPRPDLVRVVVGVDPAVSDGASSAETGIVVCGADRGGHGYVLADCTVRGTPQQAMRKVADAYEEYQADRVVAEVNNGGDYIGTLLHVVDPGIAYRAVTATRGKQTRAEPVSALYEQHRVHHLGSFPQLEDQLCSWAPTDQESPDRLDACLAAGTPVLTARGDVPVEDVIPGEAVWTRFGWKPVTASRCTRGDAEVLTVALSSGRVLTATPDHRVWVEGKGWTRMDALVWGDRLSAWQSLPSPSSTEASRTSATRTPGSAQAGSTTSPHGAAGMTPSTVTSGGTVTLARPSRPAGTSTTRITTRSTTTPATSYSYRRPSTARNTRTSSPTPGEPTPKPSGPSLPSGTAAPKVTTGTLSTASARGRTASQHTAGPVPIAVPSSSPYGASAATSATAPAAASIAPASGNTSKPSSAPSAAVSFSRTSTASGPRPVPVSVVGLYAEPERRDVYDLTVADAHEFAAAGVIVHNCVWAFTDLKDLIGGSYMDAYGVTKCAKCARPYLATVDGKPRDRCPHCHAPVEPA